MSNKQNDIWNEMQEENYWEFRNALDKKDMDKLEEIAFGPHPMAGEIKNRQENENLLNDNTIINDYMIK